MVVLEWRKGTSWRQGEVLIGKVCWSGRAGRKDNIKAGNGLAMEERGKWKQGNSVPVSDHRSILSLGHYLSDGICAV